MSNKMMDQIASMLAEGRRNSATRILTLTRIRGESCGCLPGPDPNSTADPNRRPTFSAVGEESSTDSVTGTEESQPLTLATMSAQQSQPQHTHTHKRPAGGQNCPCCPAIEIQHDKIRVYDPELWRWQGNANVGNTVSALYAKVIVIMGIAFPMAETISTHIPPSYYEGFYLYLYFVSILVMAYLFGQMFHFRRKLRRLTLAQKARAWARVLGWTKNQSRSSDSSVSGTDSGGESDHVSDFTGHQHQNGLIPTIYVEDTSSTGGDDAHMKHEAVAIDILHCIHKINGLVPRNAASCPLCEYLDKNDARRLTAIHGRGAPRTKKIIP